jgi:hypothetical protein
MFGSELKSLWIKKGVPFHCYSISVKDCALDSLPTVAKP